MGGEATFRTMTGDNRQAPRILLLAKTLSRQKANAALGVNCRGALFVFRKAIPTSLIVNERWSFPFPNLA